MVGTFLPNLGTQGLWVVELFASYATDRQTDGGTDKSNAYCSLSYARCIIMEFGIKSIIHNETATNG